MLKDKPTKLFLILSAFFVANALIAECIGGKIFSLQKILTFLPSEFNMFGQKDLSFSLSAGVLMWPVVFLMTDIINEYFGLKGVRFLSYLAVVLIAYALVAFSGAIALPAAEWWLTSNKNVPDLQKAYNTVFTQSNWMIVGSLTAFLTAQLIDVSIFHNIKRLTGEYQVWLRSTGSTVISQLIDTYVVLFIGFYIGSNWTLSQVLAVGIVNYSYKFLVAIILTPLIYLMHRLIDKYLGSDVANELKRTAMSPSNK